MTAVRAVQVVCVCVAAALLSAAETARAYGDAASRLDLALGKVIVSTHPDGRKARLWLRRDGTYAAQSRAGNRSGGVWKVKGEKLCLSQRAPAPIPIAYCRPVPTETLGRPWRDKAVNGDQVSNEIVRDGQPRSHAQAGPTSDAVVLPPSRADRINPSRP